MKDPGWKQRTAETRQAPPPPPPVRAGTAAVAPAPTGDVDDEAPYLAAWLSYRRRWREIWVTGVLGWLTLAALVWILPRFQWGETVLSALFPIWGMTWFAGTLVALLRLVAFSCPRCGRTYFNPLVTPMAQMKCRSCGLRKFHVDDRGTSLYRLLRLRERERE
jgi:hypothetical protein